MEHEPQTTLQPKGSLPHHSPQTLEDHEPVAQQTGALGLPQY